VAYGGEDCIGGISIAFLEIAAAEMASHTITRGGRVAHCVVSAIIVQIDDDLHTVRFRVGEKTLEVRNLGLIQWPALVENIPN
jgi:hypothetical protein